MYAYFSVVSLVTGVIIHAIGTDTEPQWPPFCQLTGPQASLHSDTTAGQFFSEMFTPAVWDLLVDETNRYAHFRLRNPPSGILHNWHDTCREEMMSFGLILTMGTVQLILRSHIAWWCDTARNSYNRAGVAFIRTRRELVPRPREG